MARPNIVNNTKISGRFTDEGKDVNKSVQTPDKAPSSPSFSSSSINCASLKQPLATAV